jgi:hypothetical protein
MDPRRASLSGAAAVAVMLIALLACNFPGLAPTPDFEATAVVRTVLARQTEGALQTAPLPSLTWIPGGLTSTALPISTQGIPAPSSTPEPCFDRARFIVDVTIPDGSFLAPGTEFEKIWRLLNAGTCPWTTDYALVFDSGNSFGGDPVIQFAERIVPGSMVDLQIDLVAPQSLGSHEGNWFLRNDSGELFGLGIRADKPFWVRINVGPTPTPEP